MRRITMLVLLFVLLSTAACHADNHALLIGIDEYQQRDYINPLAAAAAADAKGVARALQEVAGFSPANIRTLTSDGPVKPTGANILFELDQLMRKVKPGDVVFLLYSGHGIQMDRVSYLLPYDTDARTDATLKRTALSTTEFTEQLQQLPVRALILAFDMCRTDPRKSGREITPFNALSERQSRDLIVKAKEEGAGPCTVVTLFSCKPRERSWEWRDKGRGYFSYFLEEGLRRGAADGQGVVRVRNLIGYLEKAVYGAVQREEGKEQTPYTITEGTGALEVVLARGRPTSAGGETAVPPVIGPSVKERYEAALQRGHELWNQKRYDAAQLKFEEALEIDPDSAAATNMLGKISDEVKKDYVEAERLFRKAMELDPQYALPVHSLARLYYEVKKNYTEAERLFRKAIALEPGEGVYHVNLAACLLDQKRRSEALAAARRAIALGYTETHSVFKELGLKPLIHDAESSQAVKIQPTPTPRPVGKATIVIVNSGSIPVHVSISGPTKTYVLVGGGATRSVSLSAGHYKISARAGDVTRSDNYTFHDGESQIVQYAVDYR